MKPIIGILCGQKWQGSKQTQYVHKPYTEAIVAALGVPVLLPISDVKTEALLDIVDGLLFPGGIDVDPSFYQEEPIVSLGEVDRQWDQNDISFCKEALKRDMPILGICRGHQLINVASGGSLYQDIYTEPKTSLKHQQEANLYNPSHRISINEGSLLEKIFMENELWVNTSHHQAVKKVAKGFIVSAKTSDNIVEAIESTDHRFVLGLQWHPELMYLQDNKMLKPFIALCEAAKDYRREQR